MKTHSRLTALMLLLFALLSLISCSAGGEDTSAPESSLSPETTAQVITDKTTEEPVISVVAPPESTSPPETTAPPKAEDTISFLISDKGEAITSAFSEEEEKALLDARAWRLLSEHLTDISVKESAVIVEDVKNTVLSQESLCDLLLLTASEGIDLLTQGCLEDLSQAGIGITADSAGIHKTVTDSLTVAGGTYLLASEGLVSDLHSSYALKYDGTALSSDPAAEALAGNFTVELMLTYIMEEGEETLAVSDRSPLVLYAGAGGHIFGKDEEGLPASALAIHPKFSSKFAAASDLTMNSSNAESGIFTLSLLTPAGAGEIFLPLPKEDKTGGYATLIEHESISLIAAPLGVIDGGRLNRLLASFNLASCDYREAVRSALTQKSGSRGRELLNLIEESAVLDLGMILGWGDIDDLIEDELKKGSKAEDFLSDRVLEMRNNAVQAAAKIVAGRLLTY